MNKTISYFTFLYLFFIASVSYGIAVERHTLIIANEDEGYFIHILELLPSGEIITTGQSFTVGFFDSKEIGVSPDQQFVWTGATTETGVRGFKQFLISSYGCLTTTGRFIDANLSSEIKFTPNSEMLLTEGPIYRAYPDGSVESTVNSYISTYNLSPRGDINLRFGGDGMYVDKIDYTNFSINSIQWITVDYRSGSGGLLRMMQHILLKEIM